MANETKQKAPRRYEKMRDSGVEWIGMVPEHWQVRPVKAYYKIVTGFTPPSKQDDLYDDNGEIWVTISDMVTPIIKNSKQHITVDYALTHIKEKVPKGSLLYSFKLSVGNVAIAGTELYTNEAIASFIPSDTISIPFLKYSSSLIVGNAVQNIYGAAIMNQQRILNAPIVFPPLSEQNIIAEYLEKKCKDIDIVIAEAKASIEEYKAWKSSIIYEAVTKGLDPHAEMKDSGVEWLEQIPAHVNISRVGLQFDIILGKMLCPEPRTQDDTLGKYYCAANVHFDGVSQIDLKQMWFNPAEKERYLVKQGDLLVVEGGAGAGGCAICSALPKENIYIQNSIMIVRPRRNVDTHYLKYLIEFLVTHGYVDFVCNKATIPHFTKEKLANVPFPMFTCKEQKDIAQYLDGRCRKIDELITEKGNLISDLESYKKALIYEVVTGKRRVC